MRIKRMTVFATIRKSRIAGLSAGCLLLALLGCSSQARQDAAQPNPDRERRIQEALAAPRPIEAGSSLWIDELTWMEVRDLIGDGYTTAIIPTGGIEQNGPFLTTGKHNVILRALCPAIARELGKALCAPVVKFVPEGSIDPPTRAMRYAGSISLRDETFRALLDDIASSLKQHGFKDIVLIGDSGGNQDGMEFVARELNQRWKGSGAAAHFVPEYYNPGWEETERFTAEVLGVSESKDDGYHDDLFVTSMMMATDPASVRYQQRVEAGLASINGVAITPLQDAVELGRKMVEFRAKFTAKAIRESIAGAPR